MNQREAFEAWAKDHGRCFLNLDGDCYEFHYTQEAWVGWQAAIRYARGAAATACDGERVQNITLLCESYNKACTDCADAIKEALK